jgi:hypothetical protein
MPSESYIDIDRSPQHGTMTDRAVNNGYLGFQKKKPNEWKDGQKHFRRETSFALFK